MKKILVILGFVMFSMGFLTYHIANIIVEKNYDKVQTGLNDEFDELKTLINSNGTKETILNKINEIENYNNFQQTICFEG